MKKNVIALSLSLMMPLCFTGHAFAADSGLTADDIIKNMQIASASLESVEGSVSVHIDAAMEQISTGNSMPVKADGEASFQSMSNGDSRFVGSGKAQVDMAGAMAETGAISGDETESDIVVDEEAADTAIPEGGMMQEVGGGIEAYSTMLDGVQMIVYSIDNGDTWQAQPNTSTEVSLSSISEDNLIENNGFFERAEDGEDGDGHTVYTLVHKLTNDDMKAATESFSALAQQEGMEEVEASVPVSDLSEMGIDLDSMDINVTMLVDSTSGRLSSVSAEMGAKEPVVVFADEEQDMKVVLNEFSFNLKIDGYDNLSEVDIPQGALDALSLVEVNEDGTYSMNEIETEAEPEDAEIVETEADVTDESGEIDPADAFSHGHMATEDGKFKFAYDISGDLDVINDVDKTHMHVVASDYGKNSASLFMDAYTWDEDTYSAAKSDHDADIEYYTSDPAYSEIAISDLSQITVAGHPAYIYSREYTSDQYSYVSVEYACFVDCGDSGYVKILVDDLSDPGSEPKLNDDMAQEILRHVVIGE